jgi:chromosome segregation ATPase
MTKTDLQKELLEKVKPGTKPSYIKKQKEKKKNIKDEGYESDSSDKSTPTAPPLPNQQIKNSQSQINSLQKQIQTYKDFKEADLKIKEKYKGEIKGLKQIINNLQTDNKNLNKTIEELKKQGKNKEESKPELFTCYNCKNQRELSLLVLELPEGKLCQPC